MTSYIVIIDLNIKWNALIILTIILMTIIFTKLANLFYQADSISLLNLRG